MVFNIKLNNYIKFKLFLFKLMLNLLLITFFWMNSKTLFPFYYFVFKIHIRWHHFQLNSLIFDNKIDSHLLQKTLREDNISKQIINRMNQFRLL
jgi:hypothetical protein